jgi:hypothetical protein
MIGISDGLFVDCGWLCAADGSLILLGRCFCRLIVEQISLEISGVLEEMTHRFGAIHIDCIA